MVRWCRSKWWANNKKRSELIGLGLEYGGGVSTKERIRPCPMKGFMKIIAC